jgi:hypothetical protein
VVSTLGPVRGQGLINQDAAKALIFVMRRAGLHRYVGVTGAGIDVTRRRPKPWNMTPIGQPLLRSCDGPTSPSSSWTSWSRALYIRQAPLVGAKAVSDGPVPK